ncbi:MAG TPA: NifU N-terminal domain-containing protein [Acidimicrobiia bacterium]|nr:NifU N-terminal domain-containing protein [Acidimicrobiia bacterium]
MAINPAPTPNPNAMKFPVGKPVGGPATFVRGQETDNEMAAEVLSLDGVASIFMTADFVTITKTPAGSWESITPEAIRILETHLGD